MEISCEPRIIRINVKQTAIKLDKSEGHVRRILEHPEKYPWKYYGITQAYRNGRDWEVFLTPLEHERALIEQLVKIGEGAINIMRFNAFLGLGFVLTPRDMQDLFEYQIKPLPRRKTSRQREEQKKRIRENVDLYIDRFLATIAAMVTEKLDNPVCTISSTGQLPRSASAGPEHLHQLNSSNAES